MEWRTDGIKLSYDSLISGVEVTNGFYYLSENYIGSMGYIVITEIGGTDYVVYRYTPLAD